MSRTSDEERFERLLGVGMLVTLGAWIGLLSWGFWDMLSRFA